MPPPELSVLSRHVSCGSRKKKVHPLVARPLRGAGGKGRAIKEKRTFFLNFFFILLPFKNKNYFTLDNLSKYGHITLKFVGRYFYLDVTKFSKKVPKTIKLDWGGKALVA